MNLSNRQQLLGVIAIAAVTLLLGDRLLFSPLIRLWKERSAEIAQLKKSVDQGSRLLEREHVIQERWTSMRTNTLAADRTVADSQVIGALYHWSQESRISVTGVTPHWTSGTADDYATYDCRVEASGNLSQITRFLYEIEKDPLALKLDAVEVTTRDERGRELTLGLQVSGLQLNPPPTP